MRMSRRVLPAGLGCASTCLLRSLHCYGPKDLTGAAIDAEVGKIMIRTNAKGMAVAVIDRGQVGYVHAYGIRNAKGDSSTRHRHVRCFAHQDGLRIHGDATG